MASEGGKTAEPTQKMPGAAGDGHHPVHALPDGRGTQACSVKVDDTLRMGLRSWPDIGQVFIMPRH